MRTVVKKKKKKNQAKPLWVLDRTLQSHREISSVCSD